MGLNRLTYIWKLSDIQKAKAIEAIFEDIKYPWEKALQALHQMENANTRVRKNLTYSEEFMQALSRHRYSPTHPPRLVKIGRISSK